MMRPTQFDTQCVSNFRLGRIRLVEQAAIPQMRLTKPVAEFGRQLAGYSLQQPFAVCRSLIPLLLLYDDSPSNQPVRERHRGVDVANDTPPRKDNDIPYVADTVPRHRHRRRNFCQLCLLPFHNICSILYQILRLVAVDALRPHSAAGRFRLGPCAKRRDIRSAPLHDLPMAGLLGAFCGVCPHPRGVRDARGGRRKRSFLAGRYWIWIATEPTFLMVAVP